MSYATKTLIAIGAIALCGPRTLHAQAADFPCVAVGEDVAPTLSGEEALAQATAAVYAGRAHPDQDERKCYFRMAEALARYLVFEDPGDPEPRYWYAAAMGLRAGDEGGRTQVRLAQRAHEQARLTLTVAPDHPGAQYILGRLHAAVMRLSRFKRFLATQLLGGEALADASWESAEAYLEAAAREEPSIPEYHYELGALYLDTGRPELALEAFQNALRCPRVFPADALVQEVARERAERVQRELAS